MPAGKLEEPASITGRILPHSAPMKSLAARPGHCRWQCGAVWGTRSPDWRDAFGLSQPGVHWMAQLDQPTPRDAQVDATKICRFCAERMPAAAPRCSFCRGDLPAESLDSPISWRPSTLWPASVGSQRAEGTDRVEGRRPSRVADFARMSAWAGTASPVKGLRMPARLLMRAVALAAKSLKQTGEISLQRLGATAEIEGRGR